MNNLLYIAVVLIVLWIVAGITKFFAGALLHLLLVVAVVMLVLWAFRKMRG